MWGLYMFLEINSNTLSLFILACRLEVGRITIPISIWEILSLNLKVSRFMIRELNYFLHLITTKQLKIFIYWRSKNSFFEFNKFHHIFSGFELLRLWNIDKSDILKMYQKVDKTKIRLNKSISLNQIEFNYVCRFLGL